MTTYTLRRRSRVTLIAVVLAVLAAGAAETYVLMTAHLPDRICLTAKSPVTPERAPVARTGAVPQPAVSVPDMNLAGLRWTVYHGYELPVSEQAGPRDTAGGLASGYADTPLGALLAAVNIGVRTSWQFGPQVFQPTISGQVTGPFAVQMLSSEESAYEQGAAQIQGAEQSAQQVAYSYEGYTPSDATVDVVTGGTDSSGAPVFVVTQVQVQWLNGDWRVVAPPGGDWANSAAQVPSTAGYTAFPGQGG